MNCTQKKSLSVGKYVDNEHVDSVIRTYKKERWVHSSKRIGKEDSLSGWYSIEELEKFIETCKLHGADGMKFYFGAYPEDYTVKPEYAGRQTFVMVGTKRKETVGGAIDKDIYLTSEGKANILAYNFMRLCPPQCVNSGSGEIGITLLDHGEKGMSMV